MSNKYNLMFCFAREKDEEVILKRHLNVHWTITEDDIKHASDEHLINELAEIIKQQVTIDMEKGAIHELVKELFEKGA